MSPPDISTPAATLDTVMTETRQAVDAFRNGDVDLMRQRAERTLQTFALDLPRTEAGFVQGVEIVLDLFEVLIRIELPTVEAIPGGDPAPEAADAAAILPASWRLPGTENPRACNGSARGVPMSMLLGTRISRRAALAGSAALGALAAFRLDPLTRAILPGGLAEAAVPLPGAGEWNPTVCAGCTTFCSKQIYVQDGRVSPTG